MIDQNETQKIVRKYRNPVGVVLGSHSALDAWAGLRDFAIRSIIYTTRHRAEIYFREPHVGRPTEDMTDLPSRVRRDLVIAEDQTDAYGCSEDIYAVNYEVRIGLHGVTQTLKH